MTDAMTDTFTDLLPSSNIPMKAFWYRVNSLDPTVDYFEHHVTVISPNSTSSRMALESQFPNSTVSFLGCSDIILQVQ